MQDTIEQTTMRRVYWRLVPLLFLAMFFNYLDRINIGFASLRMNHDLGLSPAAFGFGASVFFAGYMLLEVPSNMMLHRLGARIWLARILISWGLVAALTAFAGGAKGFIALRFLLGIAEAGFLPGLALYITWWFPSAWRARAVGGYIIAGQVAAVLGGPISTAMMTWCDGALSLHGWQWMFILEGVPTMVLGLVFLALLTDRPADASWLSAEQRAWLQERLDRERAAAEGGRPFVLSDVLRDRRVWSLAILFGCALVGIYGLLFWLPQIIRSMGHLTLIQIGLLSAVPPLLGVIGTILVSYSSDRTGERKKHLAAVYILAGIALGASAFAPGAALAYALLCVAGFGITSGNSLFWSLNASFMTGAAAAASIAFVNTVAQFGGLIGPWMIGFVKGSTGSFALALLAISAFLLIAAAIALLLRPTERGPAKPGSARADEAPF